MILEIVAGLLGSQLLRAVACELGTSLICQIIQQTVSTVARPRAETRASQAEAGAGQTEASPAAATSPAPGEAASPRLRALPKVEVISAVPGRVRLRIPGLRDDPACAARIAATVRTLDGVASAQANALTGTLLVHFEPDETDLKAIVVALETPLPARRRATEGVPYLRLVVG